MSTVTLVKCDECGNVASMGLPGAISLRAELPAREPWLNQQLGVGERPRPTPAKVVVGSHAYDRLDYCSAECAAKHLGGAAKP